MNTDRPRATEESVLSDRPAVLASPVRPQDQPDSADWWRSIAQQLGLELHDMRDLLGAVDRDLHEWLRFARRQMVEMPDWEHTPYGPTSGGIDETVKLRAQIRAVLSSALVLPSDGWQPIETAPRDGTWVLLYRHWSNVTPQALIDAGRWQPYDDPDADDPPACFWNWRWVQAPTHWRPLPPSPKVDQ